LNSGLEDKLFLEKRNINKHLIVLSLDELFSQNKLIAKLANLPPFLSSELFDPTVIMINQIMFTFYRNYIYAAELVTNETWFWSLNNFFFSQRSLKYDYKNYVALMFFEEFGLRLLNLARVVLCYGFVSLVTGMSIRLIVKCSVLVAFGMMRLEE